MHADVVLLDHLKTTHVDTYSVLNIHVVADTSATPKAIHSGHHVHLPKRLT